MLFLGQFNYNKRGILDLTHTRFFTFPSLRKLLQECGYEVLREEGVPAPFPLALGGLNRLSRLLLWVHRGLIAVSRRLFAYQIFGYRPPPADHRRAPARGWRSDQRPEGRRGGETQSRDNTSMKSKETAVFGMGCFWGAERKFWEAPVVHGLRASRISARTASCATTVEDIYLPAAARKGERGVGLKRDGGGISKRLRASLKTW